MSKGERSMCVFFLRGRFTITDDYSEYIKQIHTINKTNKLNELSELVNAESERKRNDEQYTHSHKQRNKTNTYT